MSSHRYSARAKRTVSKSMPSICVHEGTGGLGDLGTCLANTDVFVVPKSPSPLVPHTLSLADLLTALAGVRRVLAFLAALRDDDLELVHIRCRRRSAGPAVNRRTGGKVVVARFRGNACVLFRRRLTILRERFARADRVFVVERGID